MFAINTDKYHIITRELTIIIIIDIFLNITQNQYNNIKYISFIIYKTITVAYYKNIYNTYILRREIQVCIYGKARVILYLKGFWISLTLMDYCVPEVD